MSSAAGVLGISASRNCKLKRAAVYVLRRPERSAAYQVVRENLETWLAQRRPNCSAAPGLAKQGGWLSRQSSLALQLRVERGVTVRQACQPRGGECQAQHQPKQCLQRMKFQMHKVVVKDADYQRSY